MEKSEVKNTCSSAGAGDVTITGEVKLTEHVGAVGCASKVPKKYLQRVIANLNGFKDKRVLIGNESSDDAGVIDIEGNARASVMTVDIFTPSVDDPYTFGMIAAANSISDIYAMGGKAEAALSFIGYPVYAQPEEAMTQILQGGADKLAEAGISVIGGHSINDKEIKCGYAVLGSIDKDKIIANTGAQVGDVIVLTKPIGGGVVLFAKKGGNATEEDVAEVAVAMTTLNKIAGEAMVEFGANAATDVTGFSLLGHLSEIATGSKVEVEVDFGCVPLFTAVEKSARIGAFPGAVGRNREAAEEFLDYGDLTETEQNILYSPETSGGLLVSLPAEKAIDYIAYLEKEGVTAVKIGTVASSSTTGIIRLTGSKGIKALGGNTIISSCSANKTASNSSTCSSVSTAGVTAEKSSCCSKPAEKDSGEGCLPAAGSAVEFDSYVKGVGKCGAIKSREKKLMSLALAVSHKCEGSIREGVEALRKAGVSDCEISEAVALGIAFGGVSASVFYSKL